MAVLQDSTIDAFITQAMIEYSSSDGFVTEEIMPTEARKRLKESLYKIYEQSASTAATHDRNSNGSRPPRRSRTSSSSSSTSAAKLHDTASYAATDLLHSSGGGTPNSRTLTSSTRSAAKLHYAATDYLDSEGSTNRPTKPSTDSSPPDQSFNEQELKQREKDILLIRELLMKNSIGIPNDDQQQVARTSTKAEWTPMKGQRISTMYPVMEKNSWANSLREPPPRRRRSTASRKQGRHKEISESRRSSTPSDEDEPGSQNLGSMSASRTQKFANMTASHSTDTPPKVANADGQPVEKARYDDIPAVHKNSNIIDRTNSASKIVEDMKKPSNGNRERSSSQTRQRIPADSLARSTSILMPSGATRRINLDSTGMFSRAEVARSNSARFVSTRPGSSDGSKVDLKLDNSKPRSIRTHTWRGEEPADSNRPRSRQASSSGKRDDERPAQTHKTHRRHSSTGRLLKREDDPKADFLGTRSLRHEEHAGFRAATRRRSISRNRTSLKREDERPADMHKTHRMHSSTGGSLKRDYDLKADFRGRSLRHEVDSGAGTRPRSISRNRESLKRGDESPADTHKTHRRHSSTGGILKREDDLKADFPGRSLRHEGEANSGAGTRPRSISRNRESLKREDERPADMHKTHRMHSSTGGILKRDDDLKADFRGRSLRHEVDSGAGTRPRSINRNRESLKREEERPADNRRTHRRHSSTGGLLNEILKREDDAKADFSGTRRLRGEGVQAESGADTSHQRSISRNKDSLRREDERPANTNRTHRRHSSMGGLLKREDNSTAADFPSRRLRDEGVQAESGGGTRPWSTSKNNNSWQREGERRADTHKTHRRHSSTGGNLKREDGPDFASGTRRRGISRNRSNEETAFQYPFTRQGSGRNMKDESAADFADIHGRQYTTGGNLKQENASNSSGSVGNLSRSWKADASKRSSFSPFQKHPATEHNVRMPLSKVAAASYNGGSLPFDGVVPFPDGTAGLNKFLDLCKREAVAEVPGRCLTVVLGKENSDLDSIVSTIAYAYFLHCKISEEFQYILPVINMRQEDFAQKNEVAWHFKVSGVDTSNFVFVDQIVLPQYKKVGTLRLVLVDHNKLAPYQEDDLQDTVVTIIDHNSPESVYPSVLNLEIEEVGSCCTIVAEKYADEAPEQLAGRGICRLLLGPILLDTTNLDATFAGCTQRDEHMVALLINGAGCYGRQGFFRCLRNQRYDVSHLSTKDALTKEFMEWKLGPGDTDLRAGKGRPISAAMSSLGVPLVVILSRKDIITDLRHFGKAMELDFHLIVTGYFDNFDRYHREILVVLRDNELARDIKACFRDHDDNLKLSPLFIEGLPVQMLVYKQRQVSASRKIIRNILSAYFAQY